MSIKELFNEDEWFALSVMPGMIGAAMSNAAPSGVIGTIKEMSATMRASIEGKHNFPDSQLIAELMQKAQNWDEAKEKMSDYRDRAKARVDSAGVKTREELQQLALEDCKKAVALVDERCNAEESDAYRQWTLNVARSVAEAAKEGSFLGIGGERVSPEERELLNRLGPLLRIQTDVLIA